MYFPDVYFSNIFLKKRNMKSKSDFNQLTSPPPPIFTSFDHVWGDDKLHVNISRNCVCVRYVSIYLYVFLISQFIIHTCSCIVSFVFHWWLTVNLLFRGYSIIFRIKETKLSWEVHREESQEAENTISYLLVIILPRIKKAVFRKAYGVWLWMELRATWRMHVGEPWGWITTRAAGTLSFN